MRTSTAGIMPPSACSGSPVTWTVMSRSSSVIGVFPADDNLNRRLLRAGVLPARQLGVQIRRRHDGVFRRVSRSHRQFVPKDRRDVLT
jgi:hypothetical protein